MESDVLTFLKFELGSPTAKTFLRRFAMVGEEDYKVSVYSLLELYISKMALLLIFL